MRNERLLGGFFNDALPGMGVSITCPFRATTADSNELALALGEDRALAARTFSGRSGFGFIGHALRTVSISRNAR